jgi:hypothetical protein
MELRSGIAILEIRNEIRIRLMFKFDEGKKFQEDTFITGFYSMDGSGTLFVSASGTTGRNLIRKDEA